jgi:hypothetical protein
MFSHRIWTIWAAVFALAASTSSHAASISTQGDWTTTLQARYLGSTTPDAYYDTALNITWLADANAAGTAMDWATANTWAANLNVNGATGWSLPTMTDPNATCNTSTYSGSPCGYNNPSTSELAHLFYTTLGDKAFYDTSGNPQAGSGLTNTGPFSNVQAYGYWSATESAPNTSNAWYFFTSDGYQFNLTKSYGLYAWAVHAGDVGALAVPPGSAPVPAVPVPAAVWLFGSGLIGLLGVSGKRRRC